MLSKETVNGRETDGWVSCALLLMNRSVLYTYITAFHRATVNQSVNEKSPGRSGQRGLAVFLIQFAVWMSSSRVRKIQ